MTSRSIVFKLVLFFAILPFNYALAEFDHRLWDELLKRHVVTANGGITTRVDYAGMRFDSGKLQEYLGSIASVSRKEFEEWDAGEQLAFLINTYNAATVQLVLTQYPELDSIRDIGFLFSSPFRRSFISLFAEQVSLDDIEHDMIRRWPQFEEPRIHFAVNCAAISCPPLRAEAYRGDSLDAQLDANTRRFLSNRDINFLAGNTLWISKIFDWYGDDFSSDWRGSSSLEKFLADYSEELGLSAEQAALLANSKIRIRFTAYDWSLNRSR
ncbi:MAG: DUF547 domain-containing protein [Proteobacteria bacterium]|nr:DUF547 domain-containing protein [Pseudomonadota bacterium]MDA0926456.1 DUF547 domain-containing protein [Pseudomonadota bacterium]